jgi:hypothetical protein
MQPGKSGSLCILGRLEKAQSQGIGDRGVMADKCPCRRILRPPFVVSGGRQEATVLARRRPLLSSGIDSGT